jgi:hypothetical protein
MAIKPRDSADVWLIKTFIARHGLRLVGFFPQAPAGPLRCDGRAGNLTRIPFGATMTARGDRWVTPSEKARLRYYKPVEGSAAYKAQETVRNNAGVYEDRLSVQSSGMSLEGKLPERHCLNPECLKGIAAKKHHNIEYCGAKCRERAKELRRLARKSQAVRPPHYRNESGISADLIHDTKGLEAGVISPHISRGIVSNDCTEELSVYQQ